MASTLGKTVTATSAAAGLGRQVLMVGNFLSGARGNRGYCEELADRLAARGWGVTRTSPRTGRIERLADMVATVWSTRRAYGIAHVDVFSGPSFVWAEAVCFALARLGKPYVLTLHGGSLPDFARRWPRRVTRLLAGAAVVTAPSPYLQHGLRPYHPGIVVVPNAIETASYRHVARPSPAPRLIWLRAFHAIYNPVLAVEVLARLRRRHPAATLRMIGPDKDGSLAPTRGRAVELGVADALTVVGRVPRERVAAELAEGDVFLNTTDVDNTPISVLEAMAAGLCVVSTSVGGIPHLLRDGREALLVPPRDPEAMTAAVVRLLEEPGLAGRLGTASLALVRACDWDAVLAQWEAILDRVAARG